MTHQIVELAAKEIGLPPRLSLLKPWMLRLAGLFNSDISETVEMLYQYEREYRFDSTKMTRAFGITPTPYPEGIRETVAWLKGRWSGTTGSGASGEGVRTGSS